MCLIHREFRAENNLLSQNVNLNKDISRKTTPSNSRRSSVDIGNGLGMTIMRRRRKDYNTLLKRLNVAPEKVTEAHSNPEEVSNMQ